MTVPVSISFPQLITFALPFIFAFLNTTFAPLLSQRNFPESVNAAIAYIVVIAGALLSMYAAGKFTAGMSFGQIIDALVATVTLLFSGALSSFKPYEAYYMRFIKNHIGNVVKPIVNPQATLPRVQSVQSPLRTTSPIPQRTTLVPSVKPQQTTDNGG